MWTIAGKQLCWMQKTMEVQEERSHSDQMSKFCCSFHGVITFIDVDICISYNSFSLW